MESNPNFVNGDIREIPARALTLATCEKFDYRIGADCHGNTVQVASYRDAAGHLVAQKLRTADKHFILVGRGKDMPLFGQHLWPATGRRIVVTEGEIDAMSVCQAFGLSWPAVSLPNGASGAEDAIKRSLDFLSGYNEVVIAFDMDKPGRAAAEKAAMLLPPGKAKIAELPLKDANELLKEGRIKELTSAIYNARTYRPGGLINGSDVWEKLAEVREKALPYPWEGLTAKTGGQRFGTMVVWTAGTGVGKSTVLAEVAYQLAIEEEIPVGYVALEESVADTAARFVGRKMGVRLGLGESEPSAAVRKAFDETLGTGRVWLYDHFGSLDSNDLLARLRYLIVGCGCRVIVLDHVSIVVSGMALDVDERRAIDRLMTALRSLVEETGVLLHVISHLRRGHDDKGAEEGGRVTLAMLRGSGSIAQLSDLVVGLERDLQGANTMIVRVLKNRATGATGECGVLEYNPTTGRLVETDQSFGEETSAAPF